MADERQWAGMNRSDKRVMNNLGIIPGSLQGQGYTPKFRDMKLELLDSYYENRQYDHLANWETCCDSDEYIPIRKRKPRIIYALAKVFCQRVASKLVGLDTFPTLMVDEDPDTQQYFMMVGKVAKIQSKLLEPVRRTLACGSGLVRFYVAGGSVKIESYLGKYCYPVFNESGELQSVRIQYTYEDLQDTDAKGKPKCKWYRLDLNETSDILYDNPEYQQNQVPEFKVAATADHQLGFVQAVWLRTHEDKHKPDGYSLIEDLLTMIDDTNYSLSQSSVAVGYNQDPQLTLSGMDTEAMDALIRSSSKAWDLGREGKAAFLESDLAGVERAEEARGKTKQLCQDVARVVMLDPEKFSAQAQSGKAMEVLHGPMVELINELRPIFEDAIITLYLKIGITLLMLKNMGAEIAIEMPDGWQPKSLNLVVQWPPIFPMTLQDLKDKVGVGVAASSANLVSRETITRWLSKDFNIEDIEAELAKIASQPVLNPFGGGF